MNGVLRDLRLGWRILDANPTFAFSSILTLSLAIASNAAVFALFDSIVLQPLPYEESERLATVQSESRTVSLPDFRDWQMQNHTFEGLAGYACRSTSLSAASAASPVEVCRVSFNLFSLLKETPQIGRPLQESDSRLDAPASVLISHGLWQNRFAGRSDVLGQTVQLDEAPMTVVGVMPAGFEFPPYAGAAKAEAWSALRLDPDKERAEYFLNVLGRLRSGVGLADAQADIQAVTQNVYRRLEEKPPAGLRVTSLQEEVVGDVRPVLRVFGAAVGFVLLIACVNVGGLLLSRSWLRRPEMAIRSSLGAGRGQLLRQALCESALLGLLGGAGGLSAAYFILQALVHLYPGDLPRQAEIGLSLNSVSFTLGLSIAAGLLLGLATSSALFKPSLHHDLKAARKGGAAASGRLGALRVLVAAETALVVILASGAGLSISSMWRLLNVEKGFDPKGVFTMRVLVPNEHLADGPWQEHFFQQIFQEIGSIPGVAAVGAIQGIPMGLARSYSYIEAEGYEPSSSRLPTVDYRIAAGDYFGSMGIKVLQGRAFSESDAPEAPAVAVINRALAGRLWPHQVVLGKRICPKGQEGADAWATVVGVVDDVRHGSLDAIAAPAIYRPHRQIPSQYRFLLAPGMDLTVRSLMESGPLGAAIESRVRAFDPQITIFPGREMEELVSASAASNRFIMLLLSSFAAVALALGSVGAFGVMSLSASRRRQEIGVRMAVGATQGDILRSFIGQGLVVVTVGAGLGVLGALMLGEAMKSIIFEVSPRDPAVLALTALLIAAVALLACYFPSRRASRLDPVQVLRSE